jgi:hypothetical protein
MKSVDTTLPPHLAACVTANRAEDGDLPPWLGERVRDITHDIHRAALEVAQDEDDHD